MYFHTIKSAVQANFAKMLPDGMFYVKTDKNELFNAYLAALPEDERQPHNCNCCKQFLNQVGNVVSIKNGVLTTLWDFELDNIYKDVAPALRAIVASKPIAGKFFSKTPQLGTDHNIQRLADGNTIRRTHFYAELPLNKVVYGSQSINTIQGELRTTKEVFQRALDTITTEAVATVLELINTNNLYRGAEFKTSVTEFAAHQRKYGATNAKDLYVWANASAGGRIRNTSIGTLLVDISEGKPVERAVAAFEVMVAPANYKRPTAVVTAKMVESAEQAIAELGYLSALKRRHATKDDILIENLLYVNRPTEMLNVFAELKNEAPVDAKTLSHAKTVTLDQFLHLIPTMTSLEILTTRSSNFVSLMAPVDPTAKNMFSWDTYISWTYQNNLADAVKEKVKKAGGKVDGDVVLSLEWYNYDDLDIHVDEPNDHLYFGGMRSRNGGHLDVDMNRTRDTREPVENIVYADKQRMMKGVYQVRVNNFHKRENEDVGFSIRIDIGGVVQTLSYPHAVSGNVVVGTLTKTDHDVTFVAADHMSTTSVQQEINGIKGNCFQPVNMMLYSPNHWTDPGIGNKHLFFIVEGAAVDIPLRPFFNEYLDSKLNAHRKTLELLAGKLMVQPAKEQLTGIGYSLTQRNDVYVRTDKRKVYKIEL